MAASGDCQISLRGVTKVFPGHDGHPDVHALGPIDLDIVRGAFFTVVGPSGCGKSTLLDLLAGLSRATSGHVTFEGQTLAGRVPDGVGAVFQQDASFFWLTVRDNVAFGLRRRGMDRRAIDRRVDQALAFMGLSDFAKAFPAQLSGGMRQRAALARALSLQTDILLMDEPFGALDEQTRMILGEDLSVLLAATGKTIVFVTHSLGEAVFLADRVAVFSARPGTIKQVIAVEEPHPRKPDFVTSAKFTALRNELYGLLHDEIRKTMSAEGAPPASPGALS
jgi:NitT/TauT family transport system ATP-binding protein